MEKLIQKLEKAKIEAAKMKVVYDAGIVIVEHQRTALKKLEKYQDTYYKDWLKANEIVQKLQDEVQEQKQEENERENIQ